MISKTVALLLADLGVTKTHSRPHVSNDNPYSESQFKTMKYRPDYPDRFGSIQDARAWARSFSEMRDRFVSQFPIISSSNVERAARISPSRLRSRGAARAEGSTSPSAVASSSS